MRTVEELVGRQKGEMNPGALIMINLAPTKRVFGTRFEPIRRFCIGQRATELNLQRPRIRRVMLIQETGRTTLDLKDRIGALGKIAGDLEDRAPVRRCMREIAFALQQLGKTKACHEMQLVEIKRVLKTLALANHVALSPVCSGEVEA